MLLFKLLVFTIYLSGANATAAIISSCDEVMQATASINLITDLNRKLEIVGKMLLNSKQPNISELAKELVQAQKKILDDHQISYVLGPNKVWIDLLPIENGTPLNQLAWQLHQETNHSLIRYHPQMLLQDSYSVFDSIARHDFRVIHLSHLDLIRLATQIKTFSPNVQAVATLRLIASDYLKFQLFYTYQRRIDLQSSTEFSEQIRSAPFGENDHNINWWEYYKSDSPLYRKAIGNQSAGESTKRWSIINDYFRHSKVIEVVPSLVDPMKVLYGPHSQWAFRWGNFPASSDLRGFKLSYNETDQFQSIEISGNLENAEEAGYNLFAWNLEFYGPNHKDEIRRSFTHANGRTLFQLSGKMLKPEMISYLGFLKKIYTTALDLSISDDAFLKLSMISLSMVERSELILWAKEKGWIKSLQADDIDGGMILVKSRGSNESLPMEETHPGLIIPRSSDPTKNEIIVEMGRLGSLTPGQTLNFLKIAGIGLHFRYPNSKIKIICEADQRRADIFSKYGFKKAELNIVGQSYYLDSKQQVLETDLKDFLNAVLIN